MTAKLVAAQGPDAPSIAVPQVNTSMPPVVPVVLTDGEGTILGQANGGLQVVQQAAFSLYTEAATARTTTGNLAGATAPNNVSVAFISINVTAVSGTSPSMTVSYQQQDANNNWCTIATTSAITAAGITVMSVGPATQNNHMLTTGDGQWRVAWTITGTTPSFTFQIGVTGR